MKKSISMMSQQTFNNLTPHAFTAKEFFREFHGVNDHELGLAMTQSKLIQSCADNPDVFGRDLGVCMKELTKYLVFPREYEHYLTSTVVEANRLNAKSYRPIKDPKTNKTTLIHEFKADAYIDHLRTALKDNTVLYQFGYDVIGMLLSWKATYDNALRRTPGELSPEAQQALLNRQRKNIFKYYLAYAKHYIAESREKGESASEFIKKPTVTHISRDVSRGLSQTLNIPSADYGPELVVSSKLTTNPSRRKRFDPTKMPSLFQRTGDATLDNLLDAGREYIEKPSTAGYSLKPGQILLRKFAPNNEHDRPQQYVFKVYKPSYLQKHFPDPDNNS